MKRTTYCLMFLVTLFSLLIFTVVSIKPAISADFINVNKNKEYFWRIEYNKDVCKDLEEDTNDYFSINTDIKGKKILISDIDEEIDYYDSEKEFYFLSIKISMKIYKSIDYDKGDWDKVDDKYRLYTFANVTETVEEETQYYFTFDDFIFGNKLVYGYYIIPNNLNFYYAEDSIEREMTLLGFYDEVEIDRSQDENSENLYIKAKKDNIDKVEYTIEYNSEGLLSYYELKYDDEICLIQQLQMILPESMPQIFIGIFIFCLISVIVFNLIQKSLIK